MAIDLTRLRTVFLEEFEEHRSTLQTGLLELERDPAAAERLLPELFRAAHSLKGGAQAIRLPAMATACHRLEEILAGLRDGTVAVDPAILGSLLDDVDVLVGLADELRSGPAAASVGDEPTTPTSEPTQPAPPASQPTTGPPPSATPPRPPQAASPPPAPLRPSLRVSAGHLDTMLDRTSDVLLARDRLTRLAREQQALTATTAMLERRWQEVRSSVTESMPARPAAAIAAADQAWRRTGGELESLRARTAATARLLHEAASGLEHSARTLRLQPFSRACEGFDRVVRDLTHAAPSDARRATLVVDGGDAELDSEVVSALREPLLHLVRNAVAHGIEPVEARRHAGKPETGTVRVAAQVLGDQVQVSVSDDGAGLDLARLRTLAASRGIEVGDDEAAGRVVWLAGLSTAAATDEVAGRGVGLDAVRSRVEQLGGTVDLVSRQGAGCTVTMRVPVTLSTLHALIVEAGEQTLALPSVAVQRVARVASATIRATGAGAHAPIGDQLVRLASLRDHLGLPPAPADKHHVAVLLSGPSGPAALIVDRITDARRITRRGPHPRLAGAEGVVGTTMLPTGDAVLVINPLACLRSSTDAVAGLVAITETVASRRSCVLLAEDSPTTRALEQDILEGAGYDVRIAVDGDEAWRRLREPGIDLVVTDVEMPGMDGFSLCQAIRDDPSLADLPVVLVTSKASDDDRHRGVEVGANAYLVKGAFDQAALLATIERLL